MKKQFAFYRVASTSLWLKAISLAFPVLMLLTSSAFAQLSCPSGWTKRESGTAVCLCERKIPGRTDKEFVQIVDLGAGATVQMFASPTSTAGSSNPSPKFTLYSLDQAWSIYNSSAKIFSITNGAFYAGNWCIYSGVCSDPSELSFPLKSVGSVLTGGSEYRAFDKLKLGISYKVNGSSYAQIENFQYGAAVSGDQRTSNFFSIVSQNLVSPTVLIGLVADPYNPTIQDKNPLGKGGRTLVGIGSVDSLGRSTKLLVYASSNATLVEARDSLRLFGSTKEMMLDGSGSTRLKTKASTYVTGGPRKVPNYIAVFDK